MRGFKRSPWLSGLGVLLAALILNVGQARADVTTDMPGSVVIYPKIVSDGTRDTLVTLSTTSNLQTYVHCFYVNGTGRCAQNGVETAQACNLDQDCAAGQTCARSCNSQDFDLILTAQQPTMWRASTGRYASMDPSCRVGQPCQCQTVQVGPNPSPTDPQACPGLETGVQGTRWTPLPVGTDFVGELKCVQVQQDGDTPFAGNQLKGEALIEATATGQKSEYNALTITGNAAANGGNNGDLDLLLDYAGQGGEYNVCPASIAFTTYAEGAVDAFTGATVSTELTLVPCTEMLELGATPVGVGFNVVNEFEQPLSADAVNFDCHFTRRLADIPQPGSQNFLATLGTNLLNIRVTPTNTLRCLTGANRGAVCTTDLDCGAGILSSNGNGPLGCRPSSGILGVAEEFHTLGNQTATAAVNAHAIGARTNPDIIVLPAGVGP